MSAPLAGKFQDHYEVLGVDPKAGNEAIQAAYSTLSKKYHPKTPKTGDQEQFQAVNLAYEVLSDVTLRREFDKLKGIGEEEGGPKFSGVSFFDNLGRETGLRIALLCVLYDRRRAKPSTPSLAMRHLENMLETTSDQLNFALWYLKQRGFVMSDDKSSLQITADGMDVLENNRPAAEAVMPFLKPEGLVNPAEAARSSAPASPPAEPNTAARNVLKALDRALTLA